MADFQVIELNPTNHWRDYADGSRAGRRFVEGELPLDYIGMSVNSYVPGEEAGYWHTHNVQEEIYVFLTGRGEMGLDDEVVPVSAGTMIRVGPDVMRTWRCTPDSRGALTWFCIRAGGSVLREMNDDGNRYDDLPMPW
jgi:quercetin dioxygenase-like cupin family protein